MGGIKGEFDKLDKLKASFSRLGSSFGIYQIAKSLGEEILTQIKLGFREQRNPYGKAWAPLRSRHGQILRKTGRLQNSFTYGVVGNTVVVGTNAKYASTHQHGAVIKPKGKHLLAFKIEVPLRGRGKK